MHTIVSSVSVFLALARLSCKTSEAMPQQLRPPTFSETCNYMGTVFPHGDSVTPNGTCIRVTCYGGNMRVEVVKGNKYGRNLYGQYQQCCLAVYKKAAVNVGPQTPKRSRCPRQELDDLFCGHANGTGTDYPDYCPIQDCSTYRIQF